MKKKTWIFGGIAAVLVLTGLIMPVAAWPDQVFAPYVDVNFNPPYSLNDNHAESGVQYYTLAFIVADGSGNPAWGGTIPLSDQHYLDEITRLRASGGDVIISFGGAAGTECAMIASDAATLQSAYQSVIDLYHPARIDFDIEGAAAANRASVMRRNEAIAGLQADNPGLRVSYTLPVTTTDGLTYDGEFIIQNARDNGVTIDTVNVMTMDYGAYYAPEPGKMGDYAIISAESLHRELQDIYPEKSPEAVYAMIGITPMIGQNDVRAEVFSLDDAEQVRDYVREKGIGLLSMWSIGRDNGDGGVSPWASPSYSGIIQDPYDFSHIFGTISGEEPSATPVSTPVVTASPTPVITAAPTATPTSEPASSPVLWDMNTIYTAIDRVTYGGVTYVALWWTQNVAPGTDSVWKVVQTEEYVPGAWDANAVYYAGDRATWDGTLYEAQWWTQGEQPGTAEVWMAVEGGTSPTETPSPTPVITAEPTATATPIPEPTATPTPEPTVTPTPLPTATPTPEPTATPTGSAAEWDAAAVYTGGEQVTYGGSLYEAQWWTQGETPGTVMVWKQIQTDASVPEAWNANMVYVAGDRATYGGTLYEAKWWTQGDQPGTAEVWMVVSE